jgi:hypothetical protein
VQTANNDAGKQALKFKPIEEPWSVYECEDGTVIKVRTVVSDIYRIEIGEIGKDGEPNYQIKSTTVATSTTPISVVSKLSGGKVDA